MYLKSTRHLRQALVKRVPRLRWIFLRMFVSYKKGAKTAQFFIKNIACFGGVVELSIGKARADGVCVR